MEGAKERLAEILLKEKYEIQELRADLAKSKEIKTRISHIKKELDELSNIATIIENKLNERNKAIGKIEEEIAQLNFEVQAEGIDSIFQIIVNNLPGECASVNINKDKENIKITTEICEKKVESNGKKQVETASNLGRITIEPDENKEFTVKVEVYKNGRAESFKIPNIYRIYKVIAWINNNLYYNE